MNSYQFEVAQDSKLIRQWLLQNGSPKAAKSITGSNPTKFVIEGNVSAVSIINVFDQLNFKYSAKPVGSSAPLPTIYVIG